MVTQLRCQEPGCGEVVQADTLEELKEAVNVHMDAAHNSFEMEAVIEANAEEVEAE